MEFSDCQDSDGSELFVSRIHLSECEAVDWELNWKSQDCSYVESRVWIWSCINIHRFFLESSDYRDSDASFKVSIFSSEPSTRSVNPPIERLVVEIKPVFTKKRQLECRLESKFIALFRILRTVRILTQGPNPKVSLGSCLPLVESFCLRNWRRNWSLKKLENIEFDYWEGSVMLAHFGVFSDYQKSEPSLGVNFCWNKFSSANVMLSIEILKEDSKPLVSEKSGSEIPFKSNLLASLGIFGLSEIRAMEQNYWFFIAVLLYNFTVFDWVFDGRKQDYDFCLTRKSLNTETIQFYSGDFGIFLRLSKIRTKARYKFFIKRILVSKYKFFGWDLYGGI